MTDIEHRYPKTHVFVKYSDRYSNDCPLYFFETGELNRRLYININPFPKQTRVLCVCSSLLKTLWEKEKLLVTSNFSFSNR